MASEGHYLAIDLGAESGRVILGTLSDGRLTLSEIHRFKTGPVRLPLGCPSSAQDGMDHADSSLVWDFLRFWEEIKAGIRMACRDVPIRAIGIDAWGVDFALLDKRGELISFPYHYRDQRTEGVMPRAFEKLSRQRIYELTGNQFMPLNTLFQLLALKLQESDFLKIADKMLMVPDLVNYWLTGRVASEFSEATTSQLFDPRKGDWSAEIIEAMGFPQHIFPDVIHSGTVLGPLRPALAEALACDAVVVVPPTHDTASAAAAVPAQAENYIWISSGTWSILGMTVSRPMINDRSYAGNFTNEGIRKGSYYFSKNIMGLWLVQACREQWQTRGQDYDYAQLTEMAQEAPHLKTLVDSDVSAFLEVGHMVDRIQDYCRLTEQSVPQTPGEVIRAVLQGLALRYRYAVENMEAVSGKRAEVIHIVGGGTKNQLLSQFTADALGRQVITGPVEATATGNIIAQAIAMGDVKDWQDGAAIIRDSFDIQTYQPGVTSGWDAAYERFKASLDKVPHAF